MAIIMMEKLPPTERKILIGEIGKIIEEAPLFTPQMPRSGANFHYQMSNCGPLGWISDRAGYRYAPNHPITGKPWPPFPPSLDKIIKILKQKEIIPNNYRPETCLINKYTENSKLGLHRDNTEKNLQAPIISISLGATGIFQIGGFKRSDPIKEIALESGAILILSGEDRLRFHGLKKIINGTKRINLTIRQINF
ncbi:alkylated DNA repair protein [Microcystis aeruginosa NIES-3804]|uniref:Alkylated DNA repair protein n=1 Tax=Microcystis aeruginosa NIES-3804 TaxID=2517783 RepID=A0A6H9GNP6_MICAE|nr:alpha-ketoglutarate-dependent dioxygenase AlkB [Microcystis aeruginosa]GCL52204.1 alkylated DNA repair protein [Microcystis aeruginosa NIES-3804]